MTQYTSRRCSFISFSGREPEHDKFRIFTRDCCIQSNMLNRVLHPTTITIVITNNRFEVTLCLSIKVIFFNSLNGLYISVLLNGTDIYNAFSGYLRVPSAKAGIIVKASLGIKNVFIFGACTHMPFNS